MNKRRYASLLAFGTCCSLIYPAVAKPVQGKAATLTLAEAAKDCGKPKSGTVPIFSPPLASVVTGAGRLQFDSAPSPRCPMAGVFVIPNDELIVYAETNDGWSDVMYIRRSGQSVSGWVRAARLKKTGTVGPKQ